MAASSSSSVRSWRTAFLTLRDETLTASPRTSVSQLIHDLVLSHSQSMIAAAPELPLHEVTSDLLFLMDWVANASEDKEDMTPIFTDICHFIHDICHRVSVELSASSWTLILDSSRKIVEYFLGKAGHSNVAFSGNAAFIRPIIECLETIRRVFSVYKRKYSLSENIQLVKFLLQTVECTHAALYYSSSSSGNQMFVAEFGKKIPRYSSLWEVQTVAFSMLGEALVRSGSTFPIDVWKSVMEVCRKVMDVLASKSLLIEDSVMSRFYASLLHCLHLVLTDPKCSLSDHVSGLVAALRMFFTYGLTSGPKLTGLVANKKEKELSLRSSKSSSEEPMKKDNGPYRPPHLRKKDGPIMKPTRAWDSPSLSDHESYTVDLTSSDSDCSDSDGSLIDTESVRSSNVRVAAILCIQDLCQADPKYFTTQWTSLLPTHDVLLPRKFEASLLTCLLFDPYLKARIITASALAVMLDGPSSLFLQVAEYKESTKRGSFTALSSSLGEILMQLHSGILHLIERETHSRLLASLFKILKILISSTPYSRMPGELLPTVIVSLQARIEEGITCRSDQTGLLVAAISCLTSALSASPASTHVKAMFIKEISTGFAEAESRSGVLSMLFQYSKGLSSPTICFEALQTLRAVCHNYPNIAFAFWEQVSSIVYGILKVNNPDFSTRSWKGHIGNTTGFIGEKVITAAIKIVDECLRAISGFKGTEDLFDEKLPDTPFTSDCTRMKKISSAPYFIGSAEDINDGTNSCHSGTEQWCEAIEKHIPLILWNTSAMVRAASVTCFAGVTSTVFLGLTKEKQDFILSSLINAAVEDVAPSVRSAACRAIGVISCFFQVSQSAEILSKFIHVVEINTRDPLVSVRITASWALANICESFRHCIGHCCLKFSEESKDNTSMALLTECALRLTKDGDKIKSNAVRALGNLARFVKYKRPPGVHDKFVDYMGSSFTTNSAEVLPSSSGVQGAQKYLSNEYDPATLGDSRFLERMVQAFLSCVTTGNVKVQWNVCHALSNLFLNETLRLQEMDWAPSVFSILLLLLRDSSNFKIRIQAAAALAVPASALDYGTSFSDVVQGLEHILENLGSVQISEPSSFKYRVVLEKQLSSTMLHVLSLASSSDHEPLKDFLVKKASYFEEWFKALCSSLGAPSDQPDVEDNTIRNQKKHMISKAMQSLIEVYEGRNLHTIAQKLKKLNTGIM